MQRRTRWILGGALAALAIGGGASFAVAGSADDERPITGQALQQASGAALAATGGGRVSETEVGDEDAYYEVEVTLDDGRQVDVHLNRDFTVASQAPDVESPDDRDGDGR